MRMSFYKGKEFQPDNLSDYVHKIDGSGKSSG